MNHPAVILLSALALSVIGYFVYVEPARRRVARARQEIVDRVRARGRTLFIDERPPWALPPCTICGSDACDHVRRMPGRKGGESAAVEMKLGPDGVARGELVVEHTSEIG